MFEVALLRRWRGELGELCKRGVQSLRFLLTMPRVYVITSLFHNDFGNYQVGTENISTQSGRKASYSRYLKARD